jgi:hypothetical protein
MYAPSVPSRGGQDYDTDNSVYKIYVEVP